MIVSVISPGPHLCQQIIGQSAHVIPGPSLVQVHLCLHRNGQKLSAHTDRLVVILGLVFRCSDHNQ